MGAWGRTAGLVLAGALCVLVWQGTAFADAPVIQQVTGKTDYNEKYVFTCRGSDADGDIVAAYVDFWWNSEGLPVRKPEYFSTGQRSVDVEFDVDAAAQWRPPGSKLNYRCLLKDASGNITSSASQVIIYKDNRYAWKTIETEHFKTNYYADRANAQVVSDIAEKNYKRIVDAIGYAPPEKTQIYIYADQAAYLGVGDATLRDWAGGSAYTADNLFILPASNDVVWLNQVVPHEFTHIAMDNKIGPYNLYAPLWLTEGTAMFMENDKSAADGYIEQAAAADKQGNLIPMTQINDFTFRGDDEVRLMYAESFTIVDFLNQKFGKRDFKAYIAGLAAGNAPDDAFATAYGMTPAAMDHLWQDYISKKSPGYALTLFEHADMLMFGFTGLLLVFFVIIKRRHGRKLDYAAQQEEIAKEDLTQDGQPYWMQGADKDDDKNGARR